METIHPSLGYLARRTLWSLGLLVLSYRSHVIGDYVVAVLPWILFTCGLVGLWSVLWLLFVGPLRLNYDVVFTAHDAISSDLLANLFTRLSMRGFELLQWLGLLIDEYPGDYRKESEVRQVMVEHEAVGSKDCSPYVRHPPEEREGSRYDE